MRGSGSAPARTARRSDHRPAQKTARRGVAPRRRRRCAGGSRARSVVDAARPASRSAARRRPRATSAASRAADRAEVDDPGAGRVQRGDARRVRLDRAQPVAVQAPHAGHAVGVRAALELVERGQLVGAQRDDELADPAHVDRVGLAVGVHPRRAVDAQARLQRAAARSRCRRGRRRELWLLWCAAGAASRSTTSTRSAGRRARISRATASPRMPGADDDRVVAVGGHRATKCPQRAAISASRGGARSACWQPLPGRPWFRPAFAGCPDPKTPYEREPPSRDPLRRAPGACCDGPRFGWCDEGCWDGMVKTRTTTKKAACEDCFFRRNLLCALQVDEPCPTFRPDSPEGLRPAAAAALRLPPGAPHAGGVGVSQRAGAGRAARALGEPAPTRARASPA